MTTAILLLSFLLGFLLNRANACTVAAVERAVVEREYDWLRGLGTAMGWAAFALLGAAALWPESLDLPNPLPVGAQAVGGGVLLAIGALLNGGCFLGSISVLCRGNLNVAGMLLGVGAALVVVPRDAPLLFSVRPVLHDEFPLRPGVWLGGMVLATVVVATSVVQMLRRRSELSLSWRGRFSPELTLPLVGVTGGALFAIYPDWSYVTLIDRIAHQDLVHLTVADAGGAIAIFLGAGISAALRQQFELRWPKLRPFVASTAGGLLMGLGAALIPGGNDALMLWTVPGLALYGAMAVLSMVATLWLLSRVSHKRVHAIPPDRE